MKVLIDANVLFDVVEKRQPHYAASNQILCLARRKTLEAAIASHTVANLFYFYGKECLPFLRDRLLDHVAVVAADAYEVKQVLAAGFADLEDALQSAAAEAWRASFIVTRNVKDFKASRVPTLLPSDFIRRFVRS
ncbi:MAG: PIN domain-containing protein [Verrucomicrobia bacterium]|nr:PIN domain-containing protein [Verrucomicrobiota bacterium]